MRAGCSSEREKSSKVCTKQRVSAELSFLGEVCSLEGPRESFKVIFNLTERRRPGVRFSQCSLGTRIAAFPRESFKVIFNLPGNFYFARLFLETLQKYPLKRAQNSHF